MINHHMLGWKSCVCRYHMFKPWPPVIVLGREFSIILATFVLIHLKGDAYHDSAILAGSWFLWPVLQKVKGNLRRTLNSQLEEKILHPHPEQRWLLSPMPASCLTTSCFSSTRRRQSLRTRADVKLPGPMDCDPATPFKEAGCTMNDTGLMKWNRWHSRALLGLKKEN